MEKSERGGHEAAEWKAPEKRNTPFEEMSADERMELSPDELLAMAEDEERARDEGIAEAKAGIERAAAPELTPEAQAEHEELEADLAEIEEAREGIRNELQWGGEMSAEEKAQERERLAALNEEQEAIERKMKAIKGGTREGREKTQVIRRPTGGKKDAPKASSGKAPWWKKLFGGK